MSISEVASSVVVQTWAVTKQAGQAVAALGGRFVSLFQNPVLAVATLAVSTVFGCVIGFYCAYKTEQCIKPQLKKSCTKQSRYRRFKTILFRVTWVAVILSINVLVSRGLKLPLSRIEGGVTTAGVIVALLVARYRWVNRF